MGLELHPSSPPFIKILIRKMLKSVSQPQSNWRKLETIGFCHEQVAILPANDLTERITSTSKPKGQLDRVKARGKSGVSVIHIKNHYGF